ncbi:hypothetical protein N7468_005297 [Penicillium chermesinum]|uniref:BZIP domain-containing protein n=1 Tax=Penicillium chermesinum TaxID=63820 RepID=A0A9W9TMU9_9EURO|nr:uncharacterized protein N7468_005297 [Penicillium chermesinum]KAJ5232341.1 hypothetical protein N7468_005297 [Penicillium chermesinum]KAJ6171998.1 hypothetical protein N7470_001065 [Penicillium chermesinum]
MLAASQVRISTKSTAPSLSFDRPHTLTIAGDRRLRNRLAQRAFRRRQADRLRTLLDRADATQRPQDETIQMLQDENSRLRKNLLEVQTKLARLVATMQSLTGTVTDALKYSSNGDTEPIDQETASAEPEPGPEPQTKKNSKPSADFSLEDAFTLDTDDFTSIHGLENTLVPTKPFPTEDTETAEVAIGLSSPASKLAANFDSLAQQIPSIWSFEYQMGIDPYASALAGTEESSAVIGRGWHESNSPFSDHINVLQGIMKSKIERTARPTISL